MEEIFASWADTISLLHTRPEVILQGKMICSQLQVGYSEPVAS
ncbi:hypothetical protein [Nostoc sp.]